MAFSYDGNRQNSLALDRFRSADRPVARRAGVVHDDVRRALERAGAGHVEGARRRAFRGRARGRPWDRRLAVRGRHGAGELHIVGTVRREIAAHLIARLRRDLPLQPAAALRGGRDGRPVPRADVRPDLPFVVGRVWSAS